MDYPNHNTKARKNKHLNLSERSKIEILLEEGYSAYQIAKRLGRAQNTILSEIKRGSVLQRKGNKVVTIYYPYLAQKRYEESRQNSGYQGKLCQCVEFIRYTEENILDNGWSPDACAGRAVELAGYTREQTVCTKTLYNYIDQGLLKVKNIDLHLKTSRNTKSATIRKNKKKLGRSIEERPEHVELREELGHLEADTVLGKKTKGEHLLLTMVERKTRELFALKLYDKTSEAVNHALLEFSKTYGREFNKIFKSLTVDNGSEFAELSSLEDILGIKVYYAHPYSSFERGTNERHNGLIRRFIPKGFSMNNLSQDDIDFIVERINSLPRKILGYKTPDEVFEEELDLLYAA